ncbi:2-keto-4-pentenoate hydratase [Streptomyces vastus]
MTQSTVNAEAASWEHDSAASRRADIADRLDEAARLRNAVAPVRSDVEDPNAAAAYDIQRRNGERWQALGRRRTGYKIGLTSPAVQRQLGVDQPDFGILFADMAYLDGAELDRALFIQPRVEAEVALVLEHDLDRGRHTAADVIRATAFALPALEIVDSRIRDWDITLFDTVADNGSAAAYVLGSVPVALSEVDLRACRMETTRHGETVSTGSGADCLGHPLNAVVWLADAQCDRGQPLRAGDIVLTGALGPMVDLTYGDDIHTRITGLGTVSVTTRQRS